MRTSNLWHRNFCGCSQHLLALAGPGEFCATTGIANPRSPGRVISEMEYLARLLVGISKWDKSGAVRFRGPWENRIPSLIHGSKDSALPAVTFARGLGPNEKSTAAVYRCAKSRVRISAPEMPFCDSAFRAIR